MKYVMLGTQRAWAMMARDDQKLGTFRSEYESYYEYYFIHWIATCYSNLVPIVSFATGQQQKRVRALGM